MKEYLNQFGAKISNDNLTRYKQSKNWKNNKFRNLEHTKIDITIYNFPHLLKKQFFETEGRHPKNELPIKKLNTDDFLKEDGFTKFVWYGHAVLLLRHEGKTILIDPMFSDDTAPVAPFSSKRFSKNTLALVDDLPEIDIVLLTHDHYDHLDYASIMKLKSKVKQFIVPLGCARHLRYWGIEQNIVSLDWWQSHTINNIKFTFTPTRHTSGRGIKDRDQSLWGGWLIQAPHETLFFSGDGGYGKHFKEIGKYAKSIDFAFMECGQYNKLWQHIHMLPEQSVQAAIDVHAKKAMPYHWAGFVLALHHWKEPAIRFTDEADRVGLDTITPHLGEIARITENQSFNRWWERVE